MTPRHAPAIWPAGCFLAGIVLERALLPCSIGLLLVGAAAGLALGCAASRRFSALCAGLLLATLAPPRDLAGLDSGRVLEISGRVGRATEGLDPRGVRVALRSRLARQGERFWLDPPWVWLDFAQGVAVPREGSVVRVRGLPRRTAGFANERSTPPGRWRIRVKSDVFLELESPPRSLDRVRARFRDAVEAPFASHQPEHRGVGYAHALFFGELEAVPERDQRGFRRSGLAHLLAASGMNVALAVAFASLLAAQLGRRIRFALFLFAVLVHFALVGPAPALERATLMALVALAALTLARRASALQTLALASSALVATAPDLVFDLGFQLSCAATLGIVTLAPALAAQWEHGPRSLRLALATSVAALVVTLPFSASTFASASPASIGLNLIFVPLASMLLVAAFAWVPVALLVPALASPLAHLLDGLGAPFALLANLPAGSWLSLPTVGTAGAGVAVGGGLLVLTLATVRRFRLCRLAPLALFACAPAPAPGWTELLLADVGQGEGMLLTTGGRSALIDGGGLRGRDMAAQVWLPALARRGIVALDAVAISHADLDHCGGLVDVAAHISIREVWAPEGVRGSRCARELAAWSGATWRYLAAGDRLMLGEASLSVLAPAPGSDAATSNATSLVLLLAAAGRSVLLTGDLDGREEDRLAALWGSTLACDVLKLGHHGSARAGGTRLLDAARPAIALVSAGIGNSFGHPAESTLRRLQERGIRLLRTDAVGGITLRWRQRSPIRIELRGAPRSAG